MTEWSTLRARFPDDEYNEIERIKEQYGLSFNEIIRSGVKFYVGLTLAKELVGDALEEKDITIGGKNIGEIINSPDYQKNIEQKNQSRDWICYSLSDKKWFLRRSRKCSLGCPC